MKKCHIRNLLLGISMLMITLFAFNPQISYANTEPVDENPAITIQSEAAILMEYQSGAIVYSKNPQEKLFPASMTKIMGLILVMEQLKTGKMKLNDIVTVSANAASMGGTQIFLQPGETMNVNDLLKAVAINSANDAMFALAEYVAGSEQAFVKQMNNHAKELGMIGSNFVNTTGFDDPNHYTTAQDMALAARKLISYGEAILQYTSTYDAYVREEGEPFWLVNTNKLVRYYEGMDGLKTGFTQKAGFCLAATAKRNNARWIAVTMKAPTKEIRSLDIVTLLNYGFAQYEAIPAIRAGQIITTHSFLHASKSSTPLISEETIFVVVPKGEGNESLKFSVIVDSLAAPIPARQKVGIFTIENSQGWKTEVPIVTENEVKLLTWWMLFFRTLQQIIG